MTNVNKKIYAKNPNNFAFVVKSNKDLISIGEESQSRIKKNKIKKNALLFEQNNLCQPENNIEREM